MAIHRDTVDLDSHYKKIVKEIENQVDAKVLRGEYTVRHFRDISMTKQQRGVEVKVAVSEQLEEGDLRFIQDELTSLYSAVGWVGVSLYSRDMAQMAYTVTSNQLTVSLLV